MKGKSITPVISAALLVIAVALVGFGTVGAVAAAPRIESNDYRAEVQLSDIETALVENGTIVEGDDTILQSGFRTLNGLGADGSGFAIGATYEEKLAVRNVGNIDEYVRVTVNRFWEGSSGKLTALNPAYIQLAFDESAGWKVDNAASTTERTVLYYAVPIAPGETTAPFTASLTIDPKVLTTVNSDGTLSYDGANFRVKASADAVQTHNATDAMISAWGRTV